MAEQDYPCEEKLEEFVPFDSEHVTEFGTLTIMVNGQVIEVHDTNNLHVLLSAYFKLRNNERPSNFNQELYYHILRDNNYNLNGYLANLERYEPGLLFELERIDWMLREEESNRRHLRQKMESGDIPRLGGTGPTGPTEQQAIKRAYYFSQAFDALADMALADGPDYDIDHFLR